MKLHFNVTHHKDVPYHGETYFYLIRVDEPFYQFTSAVYKWKSTFSFAVQFTAEEKDQLRRLPNKDYILLPCKI